MEELRFIISHRTAEDLKIFLGIAKINVNQPMFVGGPTALDSLIEAYLFNKRKNQVKEKIEILVAHQGTSLVIKSNFTFLNPMENASVNKDEWLMKLLLASNKRLSFHGTVLEPGSGARRHWLLILTDLKLAREAELNAVCELQKGDLHVPWAVGNFFDIARGLGPEERQELCFSAEHKNQKINIYKLVGDAKEYLCLGNKQTRQ